MIGKLLFIALGLSLMAPAAMAQTDASPTLESVRSKGFIQCGVTAGVAGFSAPDENNNWTGFEVDFCRAMAAAIFNDPGAVRYTPLAANERFDALTSGEIDVLSRTTTWTMSRDTQQGVRFVGALFYDGQGFMVRAADGISTANELSGRVVCIEAGTTAAVNVADYFASANMELTISEHDDLGEVFKAYEDRLCDTYAANTSTLASERSQAADPDAHVILPEIIAKEPMGPVVRQGDTGWFSLARWTYFAMLEAEELGVTQANVDEMLGSDNPAVKRLLGVEGDFGTPLGVTKDWAYQIIKHVGNYGESFERHVGPNTPIGLERGLNALWRDGGIQYPMPIR